MIRHSAVHFETEDRLLEKLYKAAEQKCLLNIKDFGGRRVLIEGGGYEKIWLETQPMGGEMYAKRDLDIGLNNQLLFMEHIREDGRLPGSIALINGKVTPQYDKFQGFCFPAPALNMYYLLGRDQDYLDLLEDCLRRFDAYLWAFRDSDGDGCLESWCKYDTGEDHALRYGDAPDAWISDCPPEGYEYVPIASVDVMSYSYSARETLRDIALIRKDAKEARRREMLAREVKEKIRAYLWDEKKAACFDRDRRHRPMPILTHNSLRAMYWNSLYPEDAKRFVLEHLLNPEEFWTPMPLPSVAVSDPLFRNITSNNWSGQPQALTYQRAVRALENYGFDALIPVLGQKLFEAVGEDCIFVQQYDPWSMEPSRISLEGEMDAYGPSMLSILEYTARMYGIHLERDEIYWGTARGAPSVYVQEWGDQVFRLENSSFAAEGFVNGRRVFIRPRGEKVITDLKGEIKRVIKLDFET